MTCAGWCAAHLSDGLGPVAGLGIALFDRNTMNRSIIMCVAGLAMPFAAAHAQWTVVQLHPPTATQSQAFGVFGTTQVGTVPVGAVNPAYHAVLWSGSAASMVDLHPAGASASIARDVFGIQQVGEANVGGILHASLWAGTPGSWVSLHPSGAGVQLSYASGIGGTQQVGAVRVTNRYHAALWTGSAASWVDLHPGVALDSYALGTDGVSQVGKVTGVGGVFEQAVLWTGSAASWVSLHPASVADSSEATAVSGNQQVGWIIDNIFFEGHAALWNGTAASFVDLHPPGAQFSSASDTNGTFQVGSVVLGSGGSRAAVWSGSATPYEDLSTTVPPGTWSNTTARSVWSDATTLYVAGFATNNGAGGQQEALLWSRPIVGTSAGTPFCFGDGTGTACPCTNSGSPGHGCASSSIAAGGLLVGSGVPGASGATDTLILTASDIPGPALFFQGTSPFAGGLGITFGDGLLCAGGTIVRLGVVFPTGTTASYPGGLTPLPIHTAGGTSAGDVRHYQAWYRDAATFCTSFTYNLTQGLTLTWLP